MKRATSPVVALDSDVAKGARLSVIVMPRSGRAVRLAGWSEGVELKRRHLRVKVHPTMRWGSVTVFR